MFNILRIFDDIITNTRIIAYEYEENQLRIKLQLSLSDGSSLAVKDYKFSNNQRKYSYHWMDTDGNLKIRWDNAPHWESVSTFPHHRHVETTENILCSRKQILSRSSNS